MLRVKNEEAVRYIYALYRGILKREPDKPGLKHWLNALRNGQSHTSIAEAFLNSEEAVLVAEKHNAIKKLFVPPGHFYSPIVDLAEVPPHLEALKNVRYDTDIPGVEINRTEMIATWHKLRPFLNMIPFPNNKDPSFCYFFDNPSYAWGDGSIFHALLRYLKPKNIIEIGSGYSSACALDTIQRYFTHECNYTIIDPFMDLLRRLLKDEEDTSITLIEKPVQRVPKEFFQQLTARDILFIDSTHVLRTGSDVCFLLFEIFPLLAQGVIVHIHDMFFPFEYPENWILEENRSWNELYAIRAFLTNNKHWNILFFNDYFAKLERNLIETTFPLFLRNPGGALWLERR